MYIKFDLLEKPVSNYILENIDCVCPWEYATNTYKKYFCTFRIDQITFPYGERKKEWPNFSGMFSQKLLISAAFSAMFKIKVP